ncbi:MAG: hypothetical protein WD751_03690 [Anaerolineales bacterium]
MAKIVRFLAALVFAGTLAACVQTTPEGQGIRGQVLLGPNCPVVQEDEPCPDTPYQTELVVTSADGVREIKRFSSDADGRFEVNLPAGAYSIRSPGGTGLPYCSVNDVLDVRPGRMTETTVFCDSGIR